MRYHKICGVVFNLPASKGRTSEAGGDTQAVVNTKVEVEWDRYGLYFGVTQDTHRRDSIWVVVDLLTKSAHFIPIKVKDPMDKFARLCVQNIVCLHGVPLAIVLDRDS